MKRSVTKAGLLCVLLIPYKVIIPPARVRAEALATRHGEAVGVAVGVAGRPTHLCDNPVGRTISVPLILTPYIYHRLSVVKY